MSNDVTSILVAMDVDGQTCMALISPECAQLFLGMLPAFQAGSSANGGPLLYKLPPEVVEKLRAVGAAIDAHIKKKGVTHGQ